MSSVRTVNTRRSAKQFARGQRGGIFTTSMPAIAKHGVERGRELSGAVADQEPELGGALLGLPVACGDQRGAAEGYERKRSHSRGGLDRAAHEAAVDAHLTGSRTLSGARTGP